MRSGHRRTTVAIDPRVAAHSPLTYDAPTLEREAHGRQSLPRYGLRPGATSRCKSEKPARPLRAHRRSHSHHVTCGRQLGVHPTRSATNPAGGPWHSTARATRLRTSRATLQAKPAHLPLATMCRVGNNEAAISHITAPG